MDLKVPGPFPELLEPELFRGLFANTYFSLMRKDFPILYLLEVVYWQNLLYSTSTLVYFLQLIFSDYSSSLIILKPGLCWSCYWTQEGSGSQSLPIIKFYCVLDKGDWNTCWKSCSGDWAEWCWVMSGSPGTFTIPQVRNIGSSCSSAEAALSTLVGFGLWPHPPMYG